MSEDLITLRQPDDWHLHLRDGAILESIISSSAQVFRRAVIMPNLVPPVTSMHDAIQYRSRILKALDEENSFTPLMTAFLTDETSPENLEQGFKEGVFFAAKLYPANATTNAASGVSDLNKINSVFEMMERIGLPLLIHGEVTDPDVDVFDREIVFIETQLEPLIKQFPSLKIVLEHITTEDAVQFVEGSSSRLAATITPHHLHINRNSMFSGGFKSDFYCLPVAKRERHRIALRKAATSGKPCFFLGTDSAPHLRSSKMSSCGCAGIFNAPNAIESYAEAFDQEDSLDRLEAFASEFGPAFYGLPLNNSFIKLVRKPHIIPEQYEIGNIDLYEEYLVPFHAGEILNWSVLKE